jgi:hypothetical protein
MRALLALLLLTSACASTTRPYPRTDDACGLACEHARALGCPEGDPTPRGISCGEVCRNAASIGVDIGTACISAAPDCAAVARCSAL